MWKTVQLLAPVVIPSWRFFDAIAPSPRIEYRIGTSKGRWQAVVEKPKKVPVNLALRRLFWNPEGNNGLFLTSCAERLMDAPTRHSQVQIWRAVADMIPGRREGDDVEFRLVFVRRDGAEILREVYFQSAVVSVGDVLADEL